MYEKEDILLRFCYRNRYRKLGGLKEGCSVPVEVTKVTMVKLWGHMGNERGEREDILDTLQHEESDRG